MSNQDFYQLVEQFFQTCKENLLPTAEEFYQECINTMTTKGAEYSGSDDKFANFKRLADLQQIPATSIWFTYFVKHFDSLTTFIRRVNAGESVMEIDASLSEPISGRIGDMINYLLILKGMVDEMKRRQP